MIFKTPFHLLLIQEQQQLQALIVEKKMEFERLRIEYESLLKAETEQQEFIEQLILQS